jgi:outer membrane receptor protein involved in Fe transport
MKHYFLFCILYFVLFQPLTAEEILLRGFVYDGATGEPLTGANILLLTTDNGTSTDRNGYFQMQLSDTSLTDSISIEFIGYKTRIIALAALKEHPVIYLQPSELELGDEIIIMADKINLLSRDIPHAKTTIHAEEIQIYGSSEISDILKPVPSIRIEGNDLDGRGIQIRGSNADEVNVYLDGILINDIGIDNSADLSLIPVENIQKLELVKGGNLALLGNGAFGGILNITTHQEAKERYYFEGKYGSFDTNYLLGNMNVPLGNHFILSYFGQLNRFAPEIEYFPSEQYSVKSRNNNISTTKQNHHLNLNYFHKNGRFTSKLIGYHLDYKKPNWKSTLHNYFIAASYSGRIFSISDFEIQLNNSFSENTVERIPTGSAQYISDYHSNRLNVKVTKKFSISAGELQVLSEYFHNDLKSDAHVRDVNWENRLYHAYNYDNRLALAGVFSYTDRTPDLENLSWETFLGLRGDFLANGDRDINNMMGFKINYFSEGARITPYFSIGKNVKYPSLIQQTYARELAIISGQDSTIAFLEPEYNRSIDGGIAFRYFPEHAFYDHLDVSIGLFSRTVYNALLERPFEDIIAHVQLGTNRTRGLDASITWNRLLSYFTLTGSYMHLDIENPLLYAYKPDRTASLNLQFASLSGFYFTTTYFYEGKSVAWYYDFDAVLQTENIEPFNDMDLSVGYKWHSFNSLELSVQLAAYNLFDNSGFRYFHLKKRFLQASFSVKY